MEIHDSELGHILLVENLRAKRITVHFRDGRFLLTHPPSLKMSAIEGVISELKPRLLKLKERKPARIIFSPETDFSTFSFNLHIVENNCTNYYMQLKDGILSISCPLNTDYQREDVQECLHDCIEKALRYEAKRLFPEKIVTLARKYGFKYSDVKINKSRTRWGSCSSKKSINLSYYCMLLPEYLVDFVIRHELCHTVEMNHSDRFWALLDKVSGGKAMQYTKELKNHKTLF